MQLAPDLMKLGCDRLISGCPGLISRCGWMGKWSFKTALKNHLQKCVQDAVLVRRALHLTASCSRFTPNLKKLAQCSPDEVLAGFGPVYREGNNTSKMTPKIHPTHRCPRNRLGPAKSTRQIDLDQPNPLMPSK